MEQRRPLHDMQRATEPDRRRAPLMGLIYETLAAEHPEVIDDAEGIQALFCRTIRPFNIVDRVARSGTHRLLIPNPDIDRVRQSLGSILDRLPELANNPLLTSLRRGSNDFDNNIARAHPQLSGRVLPLNEYHEDQLGLELVNRAIYYLLQKYGENIKVIQLGEQNGRWGYKVVLPDNREVVLSMGKIGVNKKVRGANISFLVDGQEVFVNDVGFFSNFHVNNRIGASVSHVSQLSLVLGCEGDRLIIDESAESIRQKRRTLLLPDTFDAEDVDVVNIWSEVERVTRALRTKMFYHLEPNRPENQQFNALFSEEEWRKINSREDILESLFDDKGWNHIREVFKAALENIAEDGSVEVNVDGRIKRVRDSYKESMFTKEIMIMAEHDPYLFLLIAERTDLLRLLPYFRGNRSIFMYRSLMMSDAMSYGLDGSDIEPKYRRDQEAYMASRERWRRSGYSGLKLFTNAARKVRRDPYENEMSSKDIDFLYWSDQDGDMQIQEGILSFDGYRGQLYSTQSTKELSRSQVDNIFEFATNTVTEKLKRTNDGDKGMVERYLQGLLTALYDRYLYYTGLSSVINLRDLYIKKRYPENLYDKVARRLVATNLIYPIGGDQYVFQVPDVLTYLWDVDSRDFKPSGMMPEEELSVRREMELYYLHEVMDLINKNWPRIPPRTRDALFKKYLKEEVYLVNGPYAQQIQVFKDQLTAEDKWNLLYDQASTAFVQHIVERYCRSVKSLYFFKPPRKYLRDFLGLSKDVVLN